MSRTRSVRVVIVEGRVVLEDGRPTLIDQDDVYATVRASAARMGEQGQAPARHDLADRCLSLV